MPPTSTTTVLAKLYTLLPVWVLCTRPRMQQVEDTGEAMHRDAESVRQSTCNIWKGASDVVRLATLIYHRTFRAHAASISSNPLTACLHGVSMAS